MILASMLTETEAEALRRIASYAPHNYRPLYRAPVSATSARKLAKLELVDIRKGDLDGQRLVRLSKLGRDVLGLLPIGGAK
jgi:hypothetical protein